MQACDATQVKLAAAQCPTGRASTKLVPESYRETKLMRRCSYSAHRENNQVSGTNTGQQGILTQLLNARYRSQRIVEEITLALACQPPLSTISHRHHRLPVLMSSLDIIADGFPPVADVSLTSARTLILKTDLSGISVKVNGQGINCHAPFPRQRGPKEGGSRLWRVRRVGETLRRAQLDCSVVVECKATSAPQGSPSCT